MTFPHHTEEEFQSLLRRLDLALDASNIGVWEHSLTKSEVTWDQRMHKLYATDMTSPVMPVEIWMKAIHPEDLDAANADFEAAALNKASYLSQFRIIWPNGEIRHIRSKANYYIDAQGDPAFIGVEWDVTADVELNRALAQQQQIAEERAEALQATRAQIEYAAEHDYLTGLPNRRAFDRYCQRIAAEMSVQHFAMMHIDLDRFKQVNDELGHDVGDLVLRNAANAIAAARGPQDFAARMGGDEFLLIVVNESDLTRLKQRADRIIAEISRGIEVNGERVTTGASIGIAANPRRSVQTLLRDSDLALYSAKRLGRGQSQLFTSELTQKYHADRRLLSEFRQALVQGAVLPHYQVQCDARSRETIGLEALARWQHPQRGLLLPEQFLQLATDSAIIDQLDAAILKCVLADIRAWEARGLKVPVISVNVSARRLASAELLADLDNLDIAPGSICFEIETTAELFQPGSRVHTHLRAARARGIEIAVVNLGSGHSSLEALIAARPDRVKLDRQLVWPITGDQEQLHMIRSLVDLAHAFGMAVTAQGVETAEHAEILRNLGCDTLQGYGFGQPAAPDTIDLKSTRVKRDFKG
nr:EAL domain-containing protein [uncultured Gellertiella sp.]